MTSASANPASDVAHMTVKFEQDVVLRISNKGDRRIRAGLERRRPWPLPDRTRKAWIS